MVTIKRLFYLFKNLALANIINLVHIELFILIARQWFAPVIALPVLTP